MNADLANAGVDFPAVETTKTWLAAAVADEVGANGLSGLVGSCSR